MRGVDYSYSHPSLSCVKKAGYEFIGRYVGSGTTAKYLTAGETAEALSFGLSIVCFYETSAGFMLAGNGRNHAAVADKAVSRLGMPEAPIYFALDVDPRGLTGQQLAVVAQFLDDACGVLGFDRVGLYGSDDAIDRYVGVHCRWGHQTYAWSGGRVSPKANFYQHLNGQNLCGGLVDLNRSITADFGQWPRPGQPPPPIEEDEDDMPDYVLEAPDRPPTHIVGGVPVPLPDSQTHSVVVAAVAAARKENVLHITTAGYDAYLAQLVAWAKLRAPAPEPPVA